MKESNSAPTVPDILSFSDLGLDFNSDQISEITSWVFENAKPVTLDHSHSSSRDKRVRSIIRKTPGILFSGEEIPEGVSELVDSIYKVVCDYSARYLGRPITPWQTKYAAIGHLYLPGDEPTEGHVDQMVSATAYFQQPTEGRKLYVAKNRLASSLDEIASDSYEILPEEGHIAFFDGQAFPHFVDAVPLTARGLGISVNMSMNDGTDPEGLVEYGYFSKDK